MGFDTIDGIIAAANAGANIANARNTAAMADLMARQAVEADTKAQAKFWVLENARTFSSKGSAEQYFLAMQHRIFLEAGVWKEHWFGDEHALFETHSKLQDDMDRAVSEFEGQADIRTVIGMKAAVLIHHNNLITRCALEAHEAWIECAEEQIAKWEKALHEKYGIPSLPTEASGCGIALSAVVCLALSWWCFGVWIGLVVGVLAFCVAAVIFSKRDERKAAQDREVLERAMAKVPEPKKNMILRIRTDIQELRKTLRAAKDLASKRCAELKQNSTDADARWNQVCANIASMFDLGKLFEKRNRIALLVDRSLASAGLSFPDGTMLPVSAAISAASDSINTTMGDLDTVDNGAPVIAGDIQPQH